MKTALTVPVSVIDELLLGHEKISLIDQFVIGSPYANPLFNLKPEDFVLSDRAVCETDFSRIQIIPYITLCSLKTNKYFMYQRGKGSGEQRLAGNYSIGLGGHIEEAPSRTTGTLMTVIINCIIRELDEEVGFKVDRNKVILSHANSFPFYSAATVTGRVHLGLYFRLPAEPEDFGKSETDVITHGQWKTLEELRAQDGLENWSSLLVNHALR